MAPSVKSSKRAQVEVSSDSDSSIDSTIASKKAVRIAQSKLASVPKKAKVAVSDSESSDAEMAPAPVTVSCPSCKTSFVPGAKPVAKVAVPAKKAPVAESSSEESSSDDEPVKPVAKVAVAAKKAPVAESSSDESSSDDEPVKKPVAKVAAPAKKAVASDSSSSEDSSSDDEPVKKPVAKAVTPAKKAVVESSDDEEVHTVSKPVAKPAAATPNAWDAAEQPAEKPEGCCSVFVGNLPWTATEDDLKWLFEDCGEIASARIATDRETGKPRGFGHVDFSSTEAVDKAMLKAGADLYGRPIRVDFGGRTQGDPGGFGGKGKGKGFGSPFGGKGKGKGSFGSFGKGKGKGGNPAFAASKGSIVDFTGSKMTFDDDE